jgi:pimeloyl-ACP methyl ester carboxylesterase
MQTVISKDGTAIAFDRSGQGLPIIVVGGALSNRTAAAPVAALLAPHFTVFAYDRRGLGSSGDTAPYAVDREIEDLEALTGEAGGSAFVFGHSSGAALALEAAAHGLAIAKLALYEPPFIVDDSRSRPPQDFAAQLAELIASGRRGDAVALFLTTGVDLPADAVAQMRNAPMWPAFEAMAHTLIYNITIMGDFSVPTERVGSVTIPTLVLDGGESPAWARRAVQAVVDALPNAQRRTLAGQTHGAAPEILAPVLAEFFAGGR